MTLSRRHVICLSAAVAASSHAQAEPWVRRYVVVYTDPTLKPVLRAVSAHFTSPVTLFAAPPALSLGLLAHGTQDDLLITTPQAAAQAAAAGLLAPAAPAPARWSNSLVIAGARQDGAALAALDPQAMLARLGDGRFALTDASPAATIDAPSVIAAMGLTQALAGRIVPAASTQEVGFLIRTGAARLGLCHRTDVRVDTSLAEIAAVPQPCYAPITYSISQTRHAWSENMNLFETFLARPETLAMLRSLGLTVA